MPEDEEEEAPSLAELVHEENILIQVDTASQERSKVVKALVQNMADTNLVPKTNTSTVTRLLNERESVGTTAIGGGVAIPHARIGFSDEPLMAFALLKNGDGFNSLDGGSVHYVFMVLTPNKKDQVHRNVLKAITTFAKKPIHLKALSGCKTPAEVKSVFQDYA
jgi:mannitol/fructose-specific phosphotransferase system IIA component (Ntr-type)